MEVAITGTIGFAAYPDAGLSIETLLPPGKGRDWNAVAMSRRGEGAEAV